MPRPRRARPAPARQAKPAPRSAAADTASDNDNAAPSTGRTRSTRSTGARLSTDENQAIRVANRSRDAAPDRLANQDVTTTSGTEPADDDTRSPIEVGRRAMATPAQRRDTSGLDLADDDVFGDLDDSFGDGDAPRAPRSADASSLTLSNFKTRSRQSSIIGRNDPPIRPASRGGTSTPGVSSSFNIGLFRRRAREPSILGTAQKPRAEATATTATAAHDSDSDGGEDFAPEAESTPLDRRRTRPRAEAASESSPDATAKASSRKRKSDGAGGDSARPEKASRTVDEARRDVDSDSDLSSVESPQPSRANLLERPVTPLNLDGMGAPPASSGSEAEDDVWPDIHTLAKRRRRPSVTTPTRADNLSDISSPPSLTHSPNFPGAGGRNPRGRGATRRARSPKWTTADLANLLPKRRYKGARKSADVHSDGEVDTSGLAQDDDELAHLDARATRRTRSTASRGRAAADPALKPGQPQAPTRRATRARTRQSSDKENQSGSDSEQEEESAFQALPDDTFDAGTREVTDVPTAEELKQATRKFKEVDRWALEFEEVAEPSSPQDGR